MRLERQQTKFFFALALVVGVALAGVPAGAVTITPTDFDTLSLGSPVASAPPLTTTFMTPDLTSQGGSAPFAIGSLESSVFFNQQTFVFTYKHVLTPLVDNPREFNTGFSVQGFNGVAGYSFGQAAALGASNPSGALAINHESDGTIDYNVTFLELFSGFWNGPNLGPLTFFFQSTLGPTNGDTYNFRNSHVGSTTNYVPTAQAQVPEPSSLLLLGSGLVGLAFLSRWKFKPRR